MTGPAIDPAALARRYEAVRAETERLAAPLSAEDQTPQSMPDASPVKWHRAHTTWFFETFVLEKRVAGYTPFDPAYRVLFNSYYNAVGEQYSRPDRGLAVAARRSNDVDGVIVRDVDDAGASVAGSGSSSDAEPLALIELGLAPRATASGADR